MIANSAHVVCRMHFLFVDIEGKNNKFLPKVVQAIQMDWSQLM